MPSSLIGFDIGGTKIAAGLFNRDGVQHAVLRQATPTDYDDLVRICAAMVTELEAQADTSCTVGVALPGMIRGDTAICANISCLRDRLFAQDLGRATGRRIHLANDADCMVLSEATDGAGKGYRTIFGVIMGTGVGGGLVMDRRVVSGPNGLTGEWGHLPLPWRRTEDGPVVPCGCGRAGCIDTSISGPGLSRLHAFMTGQPASGEEISARAVQGDKQALSVLSHFYDMAARAMIMIVHMFDPEAIVVAGGLKYLPGLCEEVCQRWSAYTFAPNLKTVVRLARHGSESGLRGAAWLGGDKHSCQPCSSCEI